MATIGSTTANSSSAGIDSDVDAEAGAGGEGVELVVEDPAEEEEGHQHREHTGPEEQPGDDRDGSVLPHVHVVDVDEVDDRDQERRSGHRDRQQAQTRGPDDQDGADDHRPAVVVGRLAVGVRHDRRDQRELVHALRRLHGIRAGSRGCAATQRGPAAVAVERYLRALGGAGRTGHGGYLSVGRLAQSGHSVGRHAGLDMQGAGYLSRRRDGRPFEPFPWPGDYGAGQGDDVKKRMTETGGLGRPGRSESPIMSRARRLLAVPAVVALVLGMTACDDNRSIGGDDPGPTTPDRVGDLRQHPPRHRRLRPAGEPPARDQPAAPRHRLGLGRPPGRRDRLPRRADRRPLRTRGRRHRR